MLSGKTNAPIDQADHQVRWGRQNAERRIAADLLWKLAQLLFRDGVYIMLFSIITVSLNSERTIGDTLKSVESQDCGDYEHIVVDGASTDTTLDIIEQHRHPRMRHNSEADRGLYYAMNKGLSLAKGDYVLFLNSDDFFCRNDALSLAALKIAETQADCIFADVKFVKKDGITPAGRVYSARHFRPSLLRFGVMPPHPSMFVKRELLNRLGGFDTSFRIAADFDFIARALLLQHGSFVPMPEIISAFRLGGVSTSGLKSKLIIGRELAISLKALGQPMAWLAVQLRYPLKLIQFRV
jgi:glycosyltransferase involved in cell wall biosynthesis